MILCRESPARDTCNFYKKWVGIMVFKFHHGHRLSHKVNLIFAHENAYSSFNWLKVKILSRLVWHNRTSSQDHGIDLANSNLKLSYKPNDRFLAKVMWSTSVWMRSTLEVKLWQCMTVQRQYTQSHTQKRNNTWGMNHILYETKYEQSKFWLLKPILCYARDIT